MGEMRFMCTRDIHAVIVWKKVFEKVVHLHGRPNFA